MLAIHPRRDTASRVWHFGIGPFKAKTFQTTSLIAFVLLFRWTSETGQSMENTTTGMAYKPSNFPIPIAAQY